MNVRPGDPVEVRDISGAWFPAFAASGIEGTHKDGKKIHDFPIVWVQVAGADAPMPWPLEDVRPAVPDAAENTDG